MIRRREKGLQRLWRRLDLVFKAVLVAGAVAAASGWRPAAAVLLAALAGLVGSHVAIGVVAYRRTMRRPWPRVEPLPDEDW